MPRALRGRGVRRFLRNRIAIGCAAFVVALILVAIFAADLTPLNPNSQSLLFRDAGPSSRYWLGADLFGRDVLSRLIIASRVTLIASGIGLGVAIGLGVPAGLFAGLLGGIPDAIISRITDALLSLPALILAMAIIGVAGPGLVTAMVAVGIVLAPRVFRVARSAAISVVHESYIEAARADGCSSARLLLRHVLPNASGPLLVQASFALGFIITSEASLSFLGLGVQPPQSSWGSMLREAFTQIDRSVFQVFPPAVMITLTVFAFTVLGDGLRDATARES